MIKNCLGENVRESMEREVCASTLMKNETIQDFCLLNTYSSLLLNTYSILGTLGPMSRAGGEFEFRRGV